MKEEKTIYLTTQVYSSYIQYLTIQISIIQPSLIILHFILDDVGRYNILLTSYFITHFCLNCLIRDKYFIKI